MSFKINIRTRYWGFVVLAGSVVSAPLLAEQLAERMLPSEFLLQTNAAPKATSRPEAASSLEASSVGNVNAVCAMGQSDFHSGGGKQILPSLTSASAFAKDLSSFTDTFAGTPEAQERFGASSAPVIPSQAPPIESNCDGLTLGNRACCDCAGGAGRGSYFGSGKLGLGALAALGLAFAIEELTDPAEQKPAQVVSP